MSRLLNPNTILVDESRMLLLRQGQAGWGDFLSGGFLGNAGLVQVQEEGEDVGAPFPPLARVADDFNGLKP
jgi:hypothetical protein